VTILLPRRGLVLLALLWPLGGHAQAADPAAPVRALNDALLQIMRAGKSTPFAERAGTLKPAIEAAFDLPRILQTSVGPRWSSIPPPQRADLLDVFTRYTVASYVANFDGFDGERFVILPDFRQAGSDQVVQTRIVPTSGDTAKIDYVMHKTTTGWKAVDVLLDGSISRVAVQRSDFRALLASGDPGPLIASLRAKTAALESNKP
jgi:phospholipid transport system substrate-binding protein